MRAVGGVSGAMEAGWHAECAGRDQARPACERSEQKSKTRECFRTSVDLQEESSLSPVSSRFFFFGVPSAARCATTFSIITKLTNETRFQIPGCLIPTPPPPLLSLASSSSSSLLRSALALALSASARFSTRESSESLKPMSQNPGGVSAGLNAKRCLEASWTRSGGGDRGLAWKVFTATRVGGGGG